MKVVNSLEMASIDQETQQRFGFPDLLLMENAGLKIYLHIVKNVILNEDYDSQIVFLVGKGNNGGDALVIARQFFLAGWKNIFIILVNGVPATGTIAFLNFRICQTLQINIIDYKKDKTHCLKILSKAKYIIDGILGTGITGEVKEPINDLLNKVNKYPGIRIAVDIPTGISDYFQNGFTAFRAHYTFTVEIPKLCLYLPYARPYSGKIFHIKIGFPPALTEDDNLKGELLQYNEFFKLLPPVAKEAHKSQRGHCAVFAGSMGTSGAAYLCAYAAARTRLGLVSLFTDDRIYPILASKFSSVMIHPLSNVKQELPLFKKKFSGLLIGPGWGVDQEKEYLLEKLVSLAIPGVLDADGITLLSRLMKKKRILFKNNFVLTPHPGEFVRLSGGSTQDLLNNPLPKLMELSSKLNTPIILKGHVSFLVSPHGDYWILDGMNPALATGGSGDVLAGIIAGFIASGIPIIKAGKLGLLLHAKLGEYVFNKNGWFLAEDLISYISEGLFPMEGNAVWK
jgi:hydroxyethylthiazole kinase-like uncharacterized protein yjeF